MRRHGSLDRALILARRHGPTAPIWRKRAAILTGAVALGLAALLFARLADEANDLFMQFYHLAKWAPLILTPLAFAGLVWITRRIAPEARGSGIPQIMAARVDPEGSLRTLASAKTATVKFVVTLLALLAGASVGREGPTVQISATIMAYAHRLFRVPVRASVMVAGGAAGVAAAFNTPLAGVTFAIEELAAAYEQRMTLLVMTAVLISGMVSLGLAGDYVYFGAMTDTLAFGRALLVVPVAGIVGGITGGLFSRLMLDFNVSRRAPILWVRARPVRTAAVMGLIVAGIGCATGLTWGTSYEPARLIIIGADAPAWFGPAKFAATLATALSGLPGGIFAPSLAAGAGLGDLLRGLFPASAAGPVVLLGMIGYFTGVVRAPLTAVVIISEATASHGLLLPLLATALIADSVAGLVCRERLYHGLSQAFLPKDAEAPAH
ncbi:chloride channel protein [Sphingomonas abietis]|uniref:Chloride channel protein n=1 Tax=Sphingomonas abietis TaxID=3012344 RepID=A0ABY7NQY6_9SPHN|nr:chloride channel protein [Sphingomonas abietis]WBO23038.1 chloride channel protein [Sphingomonas abietis]